MGELTDLWVGTQNWLFETTVGPVIFWLGQMAWYEPAYNAVEFVMLGALQIAVIALGMRFFERRWPLEKAGDDRLIGVDRVYTVLNKLGIIPFGIFVITYPISQEIELLMRSWGMAPPRLERLVPWLGDNVLASFLVYFVLYDFAAYWLHRAQHAIPWWWALHSLHHSQRQLTVWADDRNHVLDDVLAATYFAVVALLIGVAPGQFVLILLLSRLIESFSHANVRFGFGRVLDKLVVDTWFHRTHHALANPAEPRIHDSNFGAVLPVWDLLFGTAVYDYKRRPTGVDSPDADADNGKGWLGQQIAALGRLGRAILTTFRPRRVAHPAE